MFFHRKNYSSLCLLLLLVLVNSSALAINLSEGRHYARLPKNLAKQKVVDLFINDDSNKIQIMQFFSYACAGCYLFEPKLQSWLRKNEDKYNLVQVPVLFRKNWSILAKAYYASKEIGALDQSHGILFHSIHQNRVRINSDEELFSLLEKNVNMNHFKAAYYSAEINNKMLHADKLTSSLQVAFIPETIVKINKDFYMITANLPKDVSIIDVIEYLAAKNS